MTGLDINKEQIIEIACAITTPKVTKISKGPDFIINAPDSLLA